MIVTLMIFLVIWIIFVLAAKFIPEKHPPQIEQNDIAKIRQKYKKIELLALLGIFFVVPVITFLLTKGMVAVQDAYLNSNDVDTLFVVGVSASAFAIPAMFMAILIYGIILDYVGFYLGKFIYKNEEEYQIFYYDWNKRLAYGNEIDNKKISIILAIFVVPLFLIMFYLGVNNYTKITDSQIIHNSYLSLTEKEYTYKDVTKILLINKFKNKKTGDIEQTSRHYSVIMNDGFRWITLNLSLNKKPIERDIINLISNKSNRPIVEGVHNIDDI